MRSDTSVVTFLPHIFVEYLHLFYLSSISCSADVPCSILTIDLHLKHNPQSP